MASRLRAMSLGNRPFAATRALGEVAEDAPATLCPRGTDDAEADARSRAAAWRALADEAWARVDGDLASQLVQVREDLCDARWAFATWYVGGAGGQLTAEGSLASEGIKNRVTEMIIRLRNVLDQGWKRFFTAAIHEPNGEGGDAEMLFPMKGAQASLDRELERRRIVNPPAVARSACALPPSAWPFGTQDLVDQLVAAGLVTRAHGKKPRLALVAAAWPDSSAPAVSLTECRLVGGAGAREVVADLVAWIRSQGAKAVKDGVMVEKVDAWLAEWRQECVARFLVDAGRVRDEGRELAVLPPPATGAVAIDTSGAHPALAGLEASIEALLARVGGSRASVGRPQAGVRRCQGSAVGSHACRGVFRLLAG